MHRQIIMFIFLMLSTILQPGWGHPALVGGEVDSADEEKLVVTGVIEIFAKGTRSETIALAVACGGTDEVKYYALMGQVGYSLAEYEGEMVTVTGYLTDNGFSVIDAPKLWVEGWSRE